MPTDTRAVVQQMVNAVASIMQGTERTSDGRIGRFDTPSWATLEQTADALEAGRALLAALPEQPAPEKHCRVTEIQLTSAQREMLTAKGVSHIPGAAPQGDSVAGSGLPLDTVRTGWPEGMLQDDDRNLSRWLANTPDARRHAREAAQLGAVSVPAETVSGAKGEDQPKRPLNGQVIVEAAYSGHKYAQGTGACVAFTRGVRFAESYHGITGGSSNE